MYSERTVIVNETGLHARPAGQLAQLAKSYACAVTVKDIANPEAVPVNAKSMMRIMGEAFKNGSVIEVSADGEGETEAVHALIAMIDAGFPESPEAVAAA